MARGGGRVAARSLVWAQRDGQSHVGSGAQALAKDAQDGRSIGAVSSPSLVLAGTFVLAAAMAAPRASASPVASQARPLPRPRPHQGGRYSQLQLLLRTAGGLPPPHGFRGRPQAPPSPYSLRPLLPLAALPTVTAVNPQAEALRNSLNGRGQRLTPQRQRVLGLFERIGEGSHLSAEEVHQRLLKGEEKVSLATVYRTLRLLSSMQLLQELELPDGGRRFELAGDTNRDHHHLVCVRCGQTEEFESHDVLQAGERAAGLHGFRLLECVLNVRAVCPSCAQAEGA